MCPGPDVNLPRPDVSTEEGRLAFIRILNGRLPRKRAIAQGLLRNEDGAVLLCRLTYKKEWDLPGGVVDPSESPRAAVCREVAEELGLSVRVSRLAAVNWLPPWRGWDDATLFLFDLGILPSRATDDLHLQPREIRDVRWCPPEDLDAHVAAYEAEMIRQVIAHPDGTAYLENSRPPEKS